MICLGGEFGSKENYLLRYVLTDSNDFFYKKNGFSLSVQTCGGGGGGCEGGLDKA